jgi:hypothetical protein
MLPQPPLLPPPHFPLPATCCCCHCHSPPLVNLQCASIHATISSYMAIVVKPPPLALPQVIATHSLLLPLLNSSATHFFCCCCRRCHRMFTSSFFCIPVRSAYQYAIIGLFMLFPPAYQYAVVGNSIKVTFSISVLVRVTTAYQYALHTGMPT